jgi:lysozyme family protein
MANVKEAVDFVLRQEDSTLSGVVTNTPGDRGGLTRFGVTAKYHADLLASGFFSINRDEALAIAEATYASDYIPHLALGSIDRTAVAIAILSFAVVEGAPRAIHIVQEALAKMGFALVPDGTAGPRTLAAINAADPIKFVSTLVTQQRSYFAEIVANDESQAKWFNGWNNRASAILSYAQRTLIN